MTQARTRRDAPASTRSPWYVRIHLRVTDRFRALERLLGPLDELLIRLLLAQIFFASALIKLSNWDAALYLARYEYPLPWIDPVTWAWLAAAIEVVGPPLLVFGLLTRLAVLPMLALTLLFPK